jgi:hypothetical protein
MRTAALVVVALACTPACIIATPAPDPVGSFAFDWSFAGESDCAQAGVDTLDVIVSQDGVIALEDDAEPCFGGGLTIGELAAGPYDVDVVAYSRNNEPLYEVSFGVAVPDGHDVNNVGVVEFAPVGPIAPQPAAEGTLGFFWDFLYPTDANIVEDCAFAGVDLVDVIVTPQGSEGEPFTETSVCDAAHQGLNIDNLNEGRYALRLVAHGSFDGADVVLYDTGDLVVEVLGGQTTDLGNIDMPRVAEGFSDFDISWVFADGSSCGANEQVTLTFQRDDIDVPDDSFAVDCSASSVVRRTFVPGHYVVTGVDGDFGATVPVDLAPNSVAQVNLALAR